MLRWNCRNEVDGVGTRVFWEQFSYHVFFGPPLTSSFCLEAPTYPNPPTALLPTNPSTSPILLTSSGEAQLPQQEFLTPICYMLFLDEVYGVRLQPITK